MKIRITFVIIAITCFMLLHSNVHALFDSAKVTLVVVGESGEPLEGVDVGVGFEKNTNWNTTTSAKNGLTDAIGRFAATGNCNGHIGYGGEKEGYYQSMYEYDFKERDMSGWKPWNPELKIVMRKIENPVPMYARNTNNSILEIPVVDKEVGFDLISFDWVKPYGKGNVSDFTFKLKRSVVDRKNFDATLTITFANMYDGIKIHREPREYGSQFHLPRMAPSSGYEKMLVLREWRHPGDSSVKRNDNFLDNDVNYMFRVRSEEKDGQLIKAMYGKIVGPIDFSAVHSNTAKIYFQYYLNPDYTRNLEFDPTRNLFGNLPILERVKEP